MKWGSRSTFGHVVAGPAYFGYDENGNRVLMADADGVTYWSYDALDRMTAEEGI